MAKRIFQKVVCREKVNVNVGTIGHIRDGSKTVASGIVTKVVR